MKISAVIITFNEEKKIERCLRSLISVADEIVVVDSLSTDNTAEICKKYDVRFIEHAFEGYIEQKNYAMNLASFDYVLSLDADEELSPKAIDEVKRIKSGKVFYDAYWFKRMTNLAGKFIKHGEWYPDRKIRLWNRKKGRWQGTNPHDFVIMDKNSTEKKINADILHYSFDTVEDYLKQQLKFIEIAAKAKLDSGEKSSLFKALYKSIYRFVKGYFLKLGFLDGKYGFIIARNSSFYTFMKYILIAEQYKNSK